MQFNQAIFKAYDVRGLVGKELTTELAEAVGKALADFLPDAGPVAVGHDMRPDSSELAAAVRKGLMAQGREVVDIGQVTSDMIYFAVGHYGMAGGAMVTASHNPGEYNGIKFCGKGAAAIGIDTGLATIRDAVASDQFKPAGQGPERQQDVTDDWITHALSFVDAKSWPAYKVAVDAGNGMAGAIVPHLTKHVPLQTTPMFFELDGTFPNHPANPLELENLQDLIAEIQKNQLDFGIAFDGDGDRAFLVDEKGRRVSGTIMTAIIAEAMLAKYPNSPILHNAICGRIVPETIKAHGGNPVRTKVGHSYIKAEMRKHDAPFAGEHSGHYYFKNNFYADSGLISALIAVDVLAQSGKKLSELADQYDKYVQSGELNSEVQDKEAKIKELSGKYSDGEQDMLDGLTVNYPDWWFNVRPSNTEPLLRLNVEAANQDLCDQKTKELLALIRA
jgi:phosphomannomutase